MSLGHGKYGLLEGQVQMIVVKIIHSGITRLEPITAKTTCKKSNKIQKFDIEDELGQR
jgi:hypothetical protein